MPTLRQKAMSFLRAVLSGRDKELQAERDAICEGCDKFHEVAVQTVTGKWKIKGHCGACGCGSNPIADIRNAGKNALVELQCPELKWPGDLDGTGLSLHEANTLYQTRDWLERGMALLQHYLDKDKPLKGQALQIFEAHSPVDAPKSHAEVVAKLNFYHRLVQQYIDAGRPIDAGILTTISGTPPQARRPQPGKAGAGAAAAPQRIPAAQFNQAFRTNGQATSAERIATGRAELAKSQTTNTAGLGI